MNHDDWLDEVERLLARYYGIGLNDVDAEEYLYWTTETPLEYVEWVGRKYDLDRL